MRAKILTAVVVSMNRRLEKVKVPMTIWQMFPMDVKHENPTNR
jgi:hypothetical protein